MTRSVVKNAWEKDGGEKGGSISWQAVGDETNGSDRFLLLHRPRQNGGASFPPLFPAAAAALLASTNLFDAIAVVNVNVNVKHARVVLEKLKDGHDNVVDVAEARRLELFGVVQTACPVDGNVTLLCSGARGG